MEATIEVQHDPGAFAKIEPGIDPATIGYLIVVLFAMLGMKFPEHL